MNFSLSLHDWSAFSFLRFWVWPMHPVCQKLLFGESGLSQNHVFSYSARPVTVFMLSVGPKSIFNRSWWYEVDHLWMWALYSSFSRRCVWPKWIFHYPCMTEVHFYASGLSKVAIRGIRFVPKLCFQLFGLTGLQFSCFRLVQSLFLIARDGMK